MSPARSAGPQVPGAYSRPALHRPQRIDERKASDVVIRANGGVAREAVGQHALVRGHFVVANLSTRHELAALADHLGVGIHRREAERDGYPGENQEPEIVR